MNTVCDISPDGPFLSEDELKKTFRIESEMIERYGSAQALAIISGCVPAPYEDD